MQDVFEKVRSAIMDIIAVEERVVVPSASLVEDLGADSLDLVKLIDRLEEEFSQDGCLLEITDDDAESILTVQQILDMLKRKGFAG